MPSRTELSTHISEHMTAAQAAFYEVFERLPNLSISNRGFHKLIGIWTETWDQQRAEYGEQSVFGIFPRELKIAQSGLKNPNTILRTLGRLNQLGVNTDSDLRVLPEERFKEEFKDKSPKPKGTHLTSGNELAWAMREFVLSRSQA